MVGYSVQCILLVSALVGCALFGTAASDKTPSLDQIGQYFQLFKPSAVEPPEQADEPLSLRLQRESLKPEGLRDILKAYKDKGEKILLRTVEDLVEMCEPSLKKCSYDEFERIIKIGDEFKETIPNLYEYSQYCLRTELRGFCRVNAAKVVQDLIKKLPEEDRNLEENLLKRLRGRTILSDEDFVTIYFHFKDYKFPADDDYEFLGRVKHSLFFHYFKVLRKNTVKPFARLMKYANHEDGMFVTPWDTLDMTVERFIRLGYSMIKERIYIRAIHALSGRFDERPLGIKGVEKILSEYRHKDVKVSNDTVGELLEMCQESVAKCNYDDFERILRVGHSYKLAHPKLFEYRRHCAVVKLKSHCLDHIDEVVPNLAKEVYDDDKALVHDFLESVQEAEPIDEAPTNQIFSNIFQAYEQVKKSKLGQVEIALSEEKDFLARLKRALFLRYLEISAESRAAPKDGILTAKRDHLSVIFENFIVALDRDIGWSMYRRAKDALTLRVEDNRLTNENVRVMLREYEHKEVKVCDETVGELVDMCEPTISNCFYDAFSEITKTTKYCKKDHPKIFQYRKYCAEQIVTGYCRENVEKLLKLVPGRISEGAKLFVFLLVKTEDDCMAREIKIAEVGEIGQDEVLLCRNEALDKVIDFTLKSGLTHEEIKKEKFNWFRRKICILLKQFTQLNHLFSSGLKDKQVQDGRLQGDFWRLSDVAEEIWNHLECSILFSHPMRQ